MEAALAAAGAWLKKYAAQQVTSWLRSKLPLIIATIVIIAVAVALMITSVAGALIAGGDEEAEAAGACQALGFAVGDAAYLPGDGGVGEVPSGGDVPGFGPGQGAQVEVARTIITVGQQAGVPARGLVVAIATSIQESQLTNLPGGDRDSAGPFQQRPSQGWGSFEQVTDATFAARAFFGGPTSPHFNPATGKASPAGLLDIDGWADLPVTVAAQRVQRSGFPDAYAKHEARAAIIVEALASGDIPPSSSSSTQAGSQTPSGPEGFRAAGIDIDAYCAANFEQAAALAPGAGYGPGAWGGHNNGRIPAQELAPIPWAPGQQLRPDAAAALVELNTAFRTRFGRDISITDSYRDFDAQVAVKAAKGWLAATPGTSNHGWALALDLGGGINTFDTPEHTWMVANASTYGWIHPTWAQAGGSKPEAWHWEFTTPAGA